MPPRKSYKRTIIEDIKRRVATGDLLPGDRLPTQPELAERYGCSIQPVKEALGILAELGIVDPHQGKGVFVAETPSD